jgi:hypothetical protein
MKTRIGFVSNSSTTSFCIYGAFIDGEDQYKAMCKSCGMEYDADTFELYDIIDDICEKVGLTYHMGYDSDGVYIGKGMEQMKDNETYGAFKKNVQDALEKLLGGKVECSVMQESWQDG